MRKILGVGICLAVAACLGLGLLGSRGEAQPAARGVEYKAVVRSDIEGMAPDKVKKNGHIEGSNAAALTAGLNALARDGWELVAVEPYSEQQVKEVRTTVTLRHYPTYVFKRPK